MPYRPVPIPSEIILSSQVHAWLTSGESVPVFPTETGCALHIEGEGEYALELKSASGWEGAQVLPASYGCSMVIEREVLRLKVPAGRSVLLERPGAETVFVLVCPPPTTVPHPAGQGKLWHFGDGKLHEVGSLNLSSGDVLWIESGTWVRGHVVAVQAQDVIIGGGGVLDGSWEPQNGMPTRPIVLERCQRTCVRNLTLVRPRHWMLTIGACEQIAIEDVRQIGDGKSTDGIDIVGSRHVRVQRCFLRNGDDNVAIKSLDVRRLASPCQDSYGSFDGDWTGDVQDILVEDCAFYNDHGGSAMEIGYETRTASIQDITFRNIDVMAVHQFGSVFGIHNGDRALVKNILWENIRVDHFYDKLLDFRILQSRWNFDAERGEIHGVHLRNIRVRETPFNKGYSISLLGSCDASKPVQNILVEDFQIGGKSVSRMEDLFLFSANAEAVKFVP